MRRLILFLAATVLLCLALAATAGFSLASPEGALRVVVGISLALGVTTFTFGFATGDYSWVDRIWSVAPVAYAWLFAAAAHGAFPSLVAAVLVTLWGARLSYNFARRGGYAGEEDYRWAVLRGRIPSPVLWQVFSALFISGFQLAVIALFSSPLLRVAEAGRSGAGPGFAFFSLLALAFLLWETRADDEQWRYQEGKWAARRAIAAGTAAPDSLTADQARGFCVTGLFRLSRHPNYFGELGFWWSLMLAGAAAAAQAGRGGLLHWTGLGALLLTALFVGSTGFTEGLSAAKYPEYEAYRRRTSAILPWFPKSAEADEAQAELPGA